MFIELTKQIFAHGTLLKRDYGGLYVKKETEGNYIL
jgi:hypothetical protein